MSMLYEHPMLDTQNMYGKGYTEEQNTQQYQLIKGFVSNKHEKD